jgi:hypothetical protein
MKFTVHAQTGELNGIKTVYLMPIRKEGSLLLISDIELKADNDDDDLKGFEIGKTYQVVIEPETEVEDKANTGIGTEDFYDK